MARSIATCEGRARSIATRTGSENHPSKASAGTWRVRAEAWCYVDQRTSADHLRFLLQGLTTSSGKPGGGGIQRDSRTLTIADLSEEQADFLLSLPGDSKERLRRAIAASIDTALPRALRCPGGPPG